MSLSRGTEEVVTLRGTGIAIFRRAPGDAWRCDESGIRSTMEGLRTLGYETAERLWRVHTVLREYLLDLAYFFPERMPSAGYALMMVLGDPVPPLVGETLEVLGEASFDRFLSARHEREPDILQGHRCSRREMELLIRQYLKVEPHCVALRPLVATTENAAQMRWHYGMWGIYRRDVNQHPVELVAVYGHQKGGFGDSIWHFLWPEAEDNRNAWRPSLWDFETVRCAVTGRVLYEWGQVTSPPDPLTPECFVQGPPDLPGLGEFDAVAFVNVLAKSGIASGDEVD